MLEPPTDPDAVTIDLIRQFLDDAAINHRPASASSLYVTGYASPFWLHVDEDEREVVLSSYWDFSSKADEASLLSFTNQLNVDWRMVQFAFAPSDHRLLAHYALSYRDGLLRRQVLRSASTFAAVFGKAIAEGRECGLLCEAGTISPDPSSAIN
jgi:hypothetical protein